MGEAVKEIIQAIKSMPRSLLFYLIAIGLTVMYWFISIYLFHRGFYDSNPIGIILLFSFALTIPYLLISTIIAAEVTVVLEDNIAKDAEFVAIITGSVALQYLFIVMGGCYIHRNKCGIEYSTFLYWTFGVVIVIAILLAFGAIVVTKERNKKKKLEEERQKKEFELGLDFINDIDKYESED